MKKFIASLVAVCFCLSFVGCGGETSSKSSSKTEKGPGGSTVTKTETSTTIKPSTTH